MKLDFIYLLKRYIQEILEAFIAYSIFNLLSNKQVPLKKNIYMSMIIGLVTLILEEYKPAYKDTIKNSIMMNLGGKLIKT